MVDTMQLAPWFSPRVVLLSCASAMAMLSSSLSAQAVDSTAAGQTAAPADGGQVGVDPAANPSQAETMPGDIIVTAQKRSERLKDVPMSITAATGEMLRDRGITSTEDLGKIVPGFTFAKNNDGLPVYFLRGVGFFDTTLGVSPAVTVYVDQIPLPFSPMSRGATLDLDRVEVLKGPQGTLFGQNSTGGAINYIAAKPTNRPEAGFALTGGRFDQVEAEAFVSGPLADGLTARLAVRNEYQSDWQYNYVNGDTNGRKRFTNGRLLVDWEVSARARIELSASGWQDRSDTQQAQLTRYTPLQSAAAGGRQPTFPIATFPTAPDNNRATSFTRGADLRQDNWFYQFAGRADVDLSDAVAAHSITSYAKYSTFVPLDFDSSIYPLSFLQTTGDIETFSQELRLDGRASRLKWMIGGNYQKDRVNERFISTGTTTGQHIGPINYDGFFVDNLQRIKTYSGFGSLDFLLTDRLTAQGSVRYSKQDRSYAGCGRDDGTGQIAGAFSFLSTIITGSPQLIRAGECVTLGADGRPAGLIRGKLDEDNWSWRGSLNYKPDRNTLLYANVTKGYKSGSFPTLPSAFASQLLPVPQESLLAYEVGGKSSFLNRIIDVDAAAFYYDYQDKQLVGFRNVPPFGALPGLVSIPKSRVWGAELTVAIRPTRGLTLNTAVTYVDTEVRSNPANPTGPYPEYNTGTVSFVGQSFPFTPKWQGVADAQYKFAVGGGTNAFLGASVTRRSGTYGSLLSRQAAAAPFESLLRIPGYTLVDARMGLSFDNDSLSVEVFGRNILNEFYLTNANRANDFTYRFTGNPATYGVTLKYRFGN